MKKHKTIFEDTLEATKWNAKLLKRCTHNLTKLLEKEHHTMMQPGSEFQTVETLDPLFQHHKLWPRMKAVMGLGVEYPLEEITKQTLIEDLKEMIQRGGHKSAQLTSNEESLIEIQKKFRTGGCYPSQRRASSNSTVQRSFRSG